MQEPCGYVVKKGGGGVWWWRLEGEKIRTECTLKEGRAGEGRGGIGNKEQISDSYSVLHRKHAH